MNWKDFFDIDSSFIPARHAGLHLSNDRLNDRFNQIVNLSISTCAGLLLAGERAWVYKLDR
jgi:hypothetical protein